MLPIPVTVIRSPRENLAKCSLRFLETRPEIRFYIAARGFRFDARGFVLLEIDAPLLTCGDLEHPLLLLDSTWHLLPTLVERLDGAPICRSLPSDVKTAYPRTSKLFQDPPAGLASVEALFLAKAMLGEWDLSLLDGYHWKAAFLASVAAAGIGPGRT